MTQGVGSRPGRVRAGGVTQAAHSMSGVQKWLTHGQMPYADARVQRSSSSEVTLLFAGVAALHSRASGRAWDLEDQLHTCPVPLTLSRSLAKVLLPVGSVSFLCPPRTRPVSLQTASISGAVGFSSSSHQLQ